VKFYLFILIACVLFATGAYANPFAAGKPSVKEQVIEKKPVSNPVYSYLSDGQRKIKSQLTTLFTQIKEKPFSSAGYLVFIALCFAYGVVHSLGPGHAKTLVSGYLLSNPSGGLFRAVTFGAVVAFGHAFTAFMIVAVIYYLMQSSVARGFDSVAGIMSRLSYFVIFCIGGYLLYKKLRKQKHKEPATTGGMLSSALIISLTPCPGAMVLSMFAFTNAMPVTGFLAVFSMALGMSLTICGVAVFTHYFSKSVSSSGRYSLAYSFLEYSGIILLMTFSTIMLI